MTGSQPSPSGRALVGLLTGLATATIWGSWAVVSRSGLTGGLDFYDMTFVRYLASGLVLLPLLLRRGMDRRGIAGVGWRDVAMMGIGCGAPYSLVVFAGIERAPAGHMAIFGPAGVMLFTIALSRLFLGERMSARQYGGLALIALGVLALGGEALATGAGEIGTAHLLFVLATFMWASSTVIARRARTDAFATAAIVSVVSLILYSPAYFLISGARIFTLPTGELLLQAFYQGLVIGVAGLALYMHTVNLLGAGRAALFTAMVPAAGNYLAYLVLDEPLTPITALGLVAVTIGMGIALLSGLAKAESRPLPATPPANFPAGAKT